MNEVTPSLISALRPKGPVEDDGDTLVIEVDWVDRRFRDALKAGAQAIAAPRDEAGMGVWRRRAHLRDLRTGREIVIWSVRG